MVDWIQYGHSPLDKACMSNNIEMVTLLLEHGANMETKNLVSILEEDYWIIA